MTESNLRYRVTNCGVLVAAFVFHDQAAAYVDHRVNVMGMRRSNYVISDTKDTAELRCIKIDIEQARSLLDTCQQRLDKLDG